MIIGLTGKKQHGKSTAAKALEQQGFVRLNFKDALVHEMKERLPNVLAELSTLMEKHYWNGKPWTVERLFEEKPPLMRALLQNYGTEVRRRDSEDYWVVHWLKRAQKIHGNIVVDDVRFLNEAEAVKAMGGKIVRVVRTDVDTVDSHQSEMEMDSIVPDFTIEVKTGEQDKLIEQIITLVTTRDA